MDKKNEQIEKEKNQINEKIYKDYDYRFKVSIIVDSGVGKSCLLLHFEDNAFNENLVPTIGVEFHIKKMKVKEKDIKLQIVSK